ncbi:MAG: FHA domain-containing protein, partial [Acidobacteriota bacterium]
MDGPDDNPTDAAAAQTATGEEFRVRIVAAAKESRVGEEFRIADGVATIGRAPENAVVLHDGSVSRRHARITRVQDGYHVEDLGSANGIWSGGRRVREATVAAGERLQVGSTVIECLGADEEPVPEGRPLAQDRTAMFDRGAFASLEDEETADRPATGLVLRFTRSADESLAGQDRELQEDSAVLGRAQGCDVVIRDGGVSGRHVRLERADGEVLVTDLGSTNGTWIDGERLDEPRQVPEGVAIRLGPTTVLEVRLPAAEAPEESEAAPADATVIGLEGMEVPAEGTVVVPAPEQLVDRTRPLEEEGELVEPRATEPFLADEAGQVWYVVSGGIELFTVSLEGGRPEGPRKHFLGILPGQCFLGFDTEALGMSSG